MAKSEKRHGIDRIRDLWESMDDFQRALLTNMAESMTDTASASPMMSGPSALGPITHTYYRNVARLN